LHKISHTVESGRRKEIFSYAAYIIHKFDVRRTTEFNTKITKTVRDKRQNSTPPRNGTEKPFIPGVSKLFGSLRGRRKVVTQTYAGSLKEC
jgi:hypothetical protein